MFNVVKDSYVTNFNFTNDLRLISINFRANSALKNISLEL